MVDAAEFKSIKAKHSRFVAKRENLLAEEEEHLSNTNKWTSRYEKALEARAALQ